MELSTMGRFIMIYLPGCFTNEDGDGSRERPNVGMDLVLDLTSRSSSRLNGLDDQDMLRFVHLVPKRVRLGPGGCHAATGSRTPSLSQFILNMGIR